jgi:hypothetical protein
MDRGSGRLYAAAVATSGLVLFRPVGSDFSAWPIANGGGVTLAALPSFSSYRP